MSLVNNMISLSEYENGSRSSFKARTVRCATERPVRGLNLDHENGGEALPGGGLRGRVVINVAGFFFLARHHEFLSRSSRPYIVATDMSSTLKHEAGIKHQYVVHDTHQNTPFLKRPPQSKKTQTSDANSCSP